MRLTLSCMLAIGLLAVSTGCNLAGHRAMSGVGCADPAGCYEAGCEDGSCQAAGLPVDGGYCADGAMCGGGAFCGDGSCGNCGRCMAALQAMKHKLGENCGRGCRGLNCGKAIGPNTGAVVYPYYTTRGPRDFLMDNPPSIGR